MIVPVINKPGYYMVPSSDGKRYYEVNRSGSCECADYLYRRAGTYDLCRHGRALKTYLEAQAACPACGGRGRFVPRMVYGDGNAPLECAVCSGTGQRATADASLLAAEDRYRAEQAELLDLFR